MEAELKEQEAAEFRASLKRLMWTARLTRPDVAFEAAARAQRYEDGVVLEQSYCVEEKGKVAEVNKINMYRKKKDKPEHPHLKIKNAIFLTKALRKSHSRKTRTFFARIARKGATQS